MYVCMYVVNIHANVSVLLRRLELQARRDAIRKFNQAREVALEARREMTIQREAAGMRIKNWEKTVTTRIPAFPCFVGSI